MAKKLKEMQISSVDLCKRGANQHAEIKLYKSADEESVKGGENMQRQERKEGRFDRFLRMLEKFMRGEASEQSVGATKIQCMADVENKTDAIRKSLQSIIADDTLTDVQKAEMMADSLQEFGADVTDCIDIWKKACGNVDKKCGKVDKEDEMDEPDDMDDMDEPDDIDEDEPNDMNEGKTNPPTKKGKEVDRMSTIDFSKMSTEDRATIEAIAKKYSTDADELSPEVRKAIDEIEEVKKSLEDEIEEVKKSLEMEKLTAIAKKYEVVGKKADELAPKLYDLKKAGEQHYNDFVALLDEQVKLSENGIFKEYGASRAGEATDLDGAVAELMKSDGSLSRAQAVCKAYETNPNLDPFTGKLK